MVGIDGRADTIRDRVSQDHYGTRRLRSLDSHGRDESAHLQGLLGLERLVGEVAGIRDEGVLNADLVTSALPGVLRQIQADGERAERLDRQIDGIAHEGRCGGDRD